MEGIDKRFGPLLALDRVDFEVRAGEVHALLGENGAGKTTLMNVLSGLYRADAGHIWLGEHRVTIASPRDAVRHRIGMVHQHFELIPTLTGLENVVIGREGRAWWLSSDRPTRDVAALGHRFGFDVDLSVPVGRLSIADQQKIEILKAIYRGVDVLILDEPTTVLTPQESDRLLEAVRAMATEGLSVVFISHKFREVLDHSHRITVMRAGRAAGTVDTSAVAEDDLVTMMIGERLPRVDPPAPRQIDDAVVLRVDGVTVTGRGAEPVVRQAICSVARGEIVGIAGVAGNGQRELAEAIVGIRTVAGGRIEVGGRDVTRASIAERIRQGLLYIPEDRMTDGILAGMSVAENLALGVHAFVFRDPLAYRPSAVDAMASDPIRRYRIAAAHPSMPAGVLSGGNIQKILVARALRLAELSGGALLLAHNPTRGLDVRTTEFVRRCLVEASRTRGGILLISSDLDELIQLCHRILVMFRGAIVADLPAEAFDPYRIGRLMTGGG